MRSLVRELVGPALAAITTELLDMVTAALRMDSGVPFHVQVAKQAGATRAEVLSAILLGLPAVGNAVIQNLPAALAAYDAADSGRGRSTD